MASETLEEKKPEDGAAVEDKAEAKEEEEEKREQSEKEEKEGGDSEMSEKNQEVSEKDLPRENEKSEEKVEESKEVVGGSKKGKRSRKERSKKVTEKKAEQESTEKKAGQESTEKKARRDSSMKEPVTPIERPARERKIVERYSEPSAGRSSASKALSIEKGSGTQLKDIPNVAFKLSKRKPDDNLQMLHTILFGKRAKAHSLKKNISQFSGYVWVRMRKNRGQK
ncbi:hypothetical protein L1049_028325 [Liquidambar formosana]|uniref:Uncharacterized protein n=1 Tax=Liquidambar formosana TaxID=63359 RepID=A0AAP0RK31_LIQFO